MNPMLNKSEAYRLAWGMAKGDKKEATNLFVLMAEAGALDFEGVSTSPRGYAATLHRNLRDAGKLEGLE